MSTLTRTRAKLGASLAVCALVLSGCGSDDSDEASNTPTEEQTDASTTTAAGDSDAPAMSSEELIAWIDSVRSDIEGLDDPCEIIETVDSGAGIEPVDEASARKAGDLLGFAYAKIAQSVDGLDDATRAKVIEVAEAIQTEAASDDLDVETYITQGPNVLYADDESFAAFGEMMQAVTAQCAAGGDPGDADAPSTGDSE